VTQFFEVYSEDIERNPAADNVFEEYLQQLNVQYIDVVESLVRHDATETFNKFLPDTFFYMMNPHSHTFDRTVTIDDIPINDIIFQIADIHKIQIHEIMYHIVRYIYDNDDNNQFPFLEDWIFNQN
jgi:hypothetical protein